MCHAEVRGRFPIYSIYAQSCCTMILLIITPRAAQGSYVICRGVHI